MKNGEGLYKWNDGSYYRGNWENNIINGFGKYIWETGKLMKVSGRMVKMHGKGLHICRMEKKISRSICLIKSMDMVNIIGLMAKLSEGTWANGKREGQGLITFANGESKVGEWKTDQRIRWV